jgi:hypothetical protein
MKRNLTSMLFIVGCLMITDSYAQKVIVEGNRVIIDASGLRNTTKVKKATGTNGTNETLGTNNAGNIGSKVSNEKVYYKFEVTTHNVGSNVPWINAVYACQSFGAGWRLPTQREWQLMRILESELKASGVVFASFSYQNWTATEIDAGNSWTVSSNIATIQESKKSKRYVRCIKDL